MASSEGIHVVRTPARTVVIMGPSSRADIRAIAGTVAGQHGELVMLATGWPLTAAQQRTINEATDAAADLRLPFEARLVYSEAELKDHLRPDDIVVVPGTTGRRAERPVPTFAQRSRVTRPRVAGPAPNAASRPRRPGRPLRGRGIAWYGRLGRGLPGVDCRSGTTVVLKCPNQQLFADRAAFSRYRREIDIARRLTHAGVQRSLDTGQHRSEPYEVLEYVDGANLRQVLADRRGDVLPIPLVLDWGAQLAAALSYLHQQGVVHRDLKPENVLVGTNGRLKICDFGAALQQSGRRPAWRQLGDAIGTPEYMSPEQVLGRPGDARSDIYALGVILYELVRGVPPFSGASAPDTMSMHLTAWPASLGALRPDVPPALVAVIGRAMRRSPVDRYPGAGDLLTNLSHLDGVDMAQSPCKPDPPMRGLVVGTNASLWRFAAAVAASFIGVVGAIIGLTLLLRQLSSLLIAYGIRALGLMLAMHALERRGRRQILGFALGSLLASSYGFLSGVWPFGIVEAVWAGVALRPP